MITNFYKDSNGWNAKSHLPLVNGKHLQISTFINSHRVIVTQVTSCILSPGCTTFNSGIDYLDRPYADLSARCTEKNIKFQHNKVLAEVDMYKKRALEHLHLTKFLPAN